jgi:hypothetical protein
MSLILDGSNGLSDVDGSAATPAIRGTDANTGIFFPAADTIAFSEGGAESMRIDGSGNLGIGTSSPSSFTSGDQLVVASSAGNGQMTLAGADNGNPTIQFRRVSSPSTTRGFIQYDNTSEWMRFATNGSERMRIDSSGNLRLGTTTGSANSRMTIDGSASAFNATGDDLNHFQASFQSKAFSASTHFMIQFARANSSTVGSITHNDTNTTYGTTSDYRLKKDVTAMTGALAKVAQLKPCTYTWKFNDTEGEGFIAHELQEVFPNAVVGEKDAVNEDGSINPQSIDTSFLVATLTAAIQELKAELDTVKTELAALKA